MVITDTWGPTYVHLGADERQHIEALARTVPTILMTGHTWATGTQLDELGLAALFVKPFDLDAMLRAVQAVLLARRNVEQPRRRTVKAATDDKRQNTASL
jgi:DNA-binding NtrC family response regulator